MPELPEVETTRRGIAPYVTGRRLCGAAVREPRLRWPVPAALGRKLAGHTVREVRRRGKYLLFDVERGRRRSCLLLHLGMSGSLRILPADTPPGRHDHVDLLFAGGGALRLRDPRRFGSIHWTRDLPHRHFLLAGLGPEPLGGDLTGDYLYERLDGRSAPVKSMLLDGRVLAGLGNIYANEALFEAGIHPGRPAGRISRTRYRRLAEEIQRVLQRALAHGGTTLRDFHDDRGRPGYFRIELRAYGREGEPCPRCGAAFRCARIGQRSSFYCPRCQR